MKQIKLQLIGLTLALFAVLIAWASVFGDVNFLFTQLVLVALSMLLTWGLFYRIDTSNRLMARMLWAIQHNDSSWTANPEVKSTSLSDLSAAMNSTLTRVLDRNQKEGEVQNNLLATFKNSPLPTALLKSNAVLKSNLAWDEWIRNQGISPNPKEGDVFWNQALQLEKGVYADPSGNFWTLNKLEFKQGQVYSAVYLEALSNAEGELLDGITRQFQVMAHESLNHLSGISSLMTAFQQVDDPVKKDELAKRMLISNQQLSEYWRNLGSEFTLTKEQKSWVLLSDVAREVLMARAADNSAIDGKVYGRSRQRVELASAQLKQVLLNVLLNAEHATKDKEGSIQIRAFSDGMSEQLEIVNTGEVIPAEIQNRLFYPFFTTRKEGKGIGLTLSRQLMRMNGGSIYLKHSTEQETCFVLRFPLAQR